MAKRIGSLASLSLAAVTLIALGSLLACGDGQVKATGPKLSGPYTQGNLTVFLIHGPDRIHGKNFLTLDEALEKKIVIVHETKQVNELTIENVSKDVEIFIQAGDIVKGGQQDRVLAFDLVVPAGAKKVPLASFCVEAGRWTGRQGEEVRSFASSKNALSTNDLKVAARAQMSQQAVWQNVAKAQKGLSEKLKSEVKDAKSESSLQLTLENKKLNEAIGEAVKKLTATPADQADAIGCVIAVNGKVIGADSYASSALFKKLWPKLLQAAAVEATAELKEGQKVVVPTIAAAQAFLADADKGKAKEKEVSKRINQVLKEGDKVLLFESRDNANGAAPLRCSYLTKTAPVAEPTPKQTGRNANEKLPPPDKK